MQAKHDSIYNTYIYYLYSFFQGIFSEFLIHTYEKKTELEQRM